MEEDLVEEVEEEEDNIEDEDEDDDYEDEDEDDDSEGEEVEDLIPLPPRVSSSITDGLVNDSNVCDGKPVSQENGGGEIDVCPICLEAWTSVGDHRICCLPCGHIYGMSCIKRWLLRRQSSGKCPKCKSLCTLKDIRVLYATRLCVADEKSDKASTTNFPYTREGFSGFQQYVSSRMDVLQQRLDALERRAEECDSSVHFLQQRHNELMGQARENSR
ncbi:hypothetical protein L1987_67706 [Smallanthus sonchifolius]|uniref:Uncharacterized protein n=1 Tax=Smallanthus sonchifolius TaxID=185202 RepID=A0ACB9B513_9ASTR|nr:hypothetical protein L1987_67706 [Smallanthus sonchifolius]